MRQMTSEYGSQVDVIEHVILSNLWEYYMLEEPDEHGVVLALVVGDATEVGSVWMDHIEPYIISRTTALGEIMPAPRWAWGGSPSHSDSRRTTLADIDEFHPHR
jgi:hypothetical protein